MLLDHLNQWDIVLRHGKLKWIPLYHNDEELVCILFKGDILCFSVSFNLQMMLQSRTAVLNDVKV